MTAESWSEALEWVRTGEADAAVPNHFYGNYFYRDFDLRPTSIIIDSQTLYYAAAASANPELLRTIDTHLSALKAEPGSTYYTSIIPWLEHPVPQGVPSWFLWILSAGGIMLLWAGSTIFILRSRVRARTRHLAEANRQLSESEIKFRSLFEHNSAVKLLVEPSTGRIVEANKAAVAFYGWPRAKLLTMTLDDLQEDECEPVPLQDVVRAGGGRYEQRHRVADGSTRDVDIFAANVRIHDETCIHLLVYDITEYRDVRERLRQAQKLEAVGRLAGGVAHDFNNFLGAIMGHAELALHSLSPGAATDASIQKNLTEILAAANRSKTVSQQLTAFARKSVTRPVPFEVHARIEDSYNILKRLLGEEIELTLSLEAEQSRVCMDPSHLDQILTNLCMNASDAIEGNGKVVISTESTEDYVRILVQDDGCGMDDATIENIFEPFYSSKGIGHGTGLGLATVYGIVEQAEGDIGVASTPGEGSTFRISLPLHEPSPDEEADAPDTVSTEASGDTILLVDDEPAIVDMTKMALETLGYRVIAAQSPSEGLKRLEGENDSIRLLMTDVVMPEMNGRELAERVRACCPGVGVLYMSGYTDSILEDKGVIDGDVHLIQKPFSMKDLSAKLKDVLGGA